MSARPALFRQADLTRALKGAAAAGIQVGRIAVRPDGGFEIFAANDNSDGGASVVNPCDRLLRGRKK